MGGVLLIEGHYHRHVVAYASRRLYKAEKHCSQIEKEALTLADASEKSKDYITWIDITLEMDHIPLKGILLIKNILADALSWNPILNKD